MTNPRQDVLNIDIGWLHIGAVGLPVIIVVAVILAEAARIEHMGLRFLRRPNNLVSNAAHLFCGPAYQQGNSPCGGDAVSGKKDDHRQMRYGDKAENLRHCLFAWAHHRL